MQHVIVGVESVWFQPCPNLEREGVMEKRKLAALVGAIWSLVVARLGDDGAEMAATTKVVKRVLRLLNTLHENEDVVRRVGDAQEGWDAYESITQREYQTWLVEVDENWKEMDWWNNITEFSGLQGDGEEKLDASDGDESEISKEEVLRQRKMRIAHDPSLGRMVDPRFEITKEKTAAYNSWKSAMLAKIEELVAQEPVDVMDTNGI